MKKFLYALALVAFIGCTPASEDPDTPTPDPTPTPTPGEPVQNLQKYANDDEIKIMSFNVRLKTNETEMYNNWDFRKDACIELIKDHKPTIIGFQEAKYTDQWLFFKEKLAANYEGWGLNRDTGEESGSGEVMGILYDKEKVRKLQGGTFWLSETPDVCSKGWGAGNYRTATWGVFEHIPTGKKFFYINTHLDHKVEEAKIEGMKLIVERFNAYNTENLPQFLTGDLNVVSTHKALDVLKGYMDNAREVAPSGKTDNDPTYNGYKPQGNSIIDHIYCTTGIKVVEYHTIDEKYGSSEYVSDHYPVYAIVKMP